MRYADKPQGRPGTCALLPSRYEDPEGWIVTGLVQPGFYEDHGGWDPEINVSIAGLKEAARLASEALEKRGQPGFYHTDYGEKCEENARLLARVEELEQENNRLQQAFDSIDGLGKSGFVIRKAPGRKKKKDEALA